MPSPIRSPRGCILARFSSVDQRVMADFPLVVGVIALLARGTAPRKPALSRQVAPARAPGTPARRCVNGRAQERRVARLAWG